MTFFLEIDLTSGSITEIVTQRSGDLQVENFMRPSARLLICAMLPPETHAFDTPDVKHLAGCILLCADKKQKQEKCKLTRNEALRQQLSC